MLKKFWKIFRAVMSVVLLFAVLAPVGVYVLLSAPGVQNGIRNIVRRELSSLLGTEVGIGDVDISPFNRLSVKNVSVVGENGDTIAAISEISAGIEAWRSLSARRLLIDYALLDGLQLHVSRQHPGAPLNIDPIIARLKSDKPDRKENPFDLRISTVLIHNGTATYDVLSEPCDSSGRFDPCHIAISDLSVNAYIPRLSNRLYAVELDHLSFAERSGFELKKLSTKVSYGADGATVDGLTIELPRSRLAFSTVRIDYDGFENVPSAFREDGLSLSTEGNNFVYPPDLKAFAPFLASLGKPLRLSLEASGSPRKIDISRLSLSEPEGHAFSIALSGEVDGLDKGMRDSISFELKNCTALLSGTGICNLIPSLLPENTRRLLGGMPVLAFNIKAKGTPSAGTATFKSDGSAGLLSFNGSYRLQDKISSLRGQLDISEFNAGMITSQKDLGLVSGTVTGEATLRPGHPEADIKADLNRIDFKGYSYSGITLETIVSGKKYIQGLADIKDPQAYAHIEGEYDARGYTKFLNLEGNLSGVNLHALGLDKSREGLCMSGSIEAFLEGPNIYEAGGFLHISDFAWTDSLGKGLNVKRLAVEALPDAPTPRIEIESDIIKGSVEGFYNFATIASQARTIATSVFPALLGSTEDKGGNNIPGNDFNYDLTITNTEELSEFLRLPVKVIYPLTVNGTFLGSEGKASLLVDAPYLQQGDKIITNTSIYARADTTLAKAYGYITSEIPTKKGLMAVSCGIECQEDRVGTHLDWTIERSIPLNGTIDLSAWLGRDEEGAFMASVEFKPGTINFGDDVWAIRPSRIDYSNTNIIVDKFSLAASGQSIAIDGRVGAAPSDSMSIRLDHISLLPIFETLEIDKALIGGRATGEFTARQVLSKEPYLMCEHLHVDSIGYNRCTLGDADIVASWNNDHKSFQLDADIVSYENLRSRIWGDIYPMGEALDINFDARHVKVGFLRPFMEAFASDIEGFATGKARLFGTFKEIDMTGDIFADDVRLKIDFTNTWYSATDSIHLDPGKIVLKDVTVRDVYGNTAKMNGIVEHTFFKEPVFEFKITDARNFLSFNGTPKQNPDWYGTIYGNGGATIAGRPGVIDIGVNMSTAPGSVFTFVLSDRLEADDYTFISFRDVTPQAVTDSITEHDDTPRAVREYHSRLNGQGQDSPSAYNMDIQVDITPEARMILVMDPVGGDEIKANGSGNLRLVYKSIDNQLNMWGSYTLERGSYNFTLQDIIIKDFTIKDGSTISFNGDPYGAEANIEAFYSVNANLSDLDESFLQDKELNRTNVPVHALMKVAGDIRQPEIKFDLEFPTLTQDTYRKVRSIVSTEDMMNRQIIYLLALNRFYTPDYMASTTKGNELFSVASSTIASQLGSMLGKLSENWSIAPNLRSDRGDFSDVEVDLALSSRLLNNRLLFNGNFGYRDKSMNSNQFIGDFDIEYLLNKRGSWRLKAYNRYNDRNFYVRTAQTTQGVGIMFKRDFDDFLSFLRHKRRKETTTPLPSDSAAVPESPDSVSSSTSVPDSIITPTTPPPSVTPTP